MEDTSELEIIEPLKNRANKKVVIGSLFFVGMTLLGTLLFLTQSRSSSPAPGGIYSPKGQLVIPAQFGSVLFFNDGMAEYSTTRYDQPLITGSGTTTDPLKLNLTESLSGFVSKEGRILPPAYKAASLYSNGLAVVSTDNTLSGAIDKNGKWKTPEKYYSLGNFYDGLAPFEVKKDSLFGYLRTDGSVGIPPKWKYAFQFSEGRAMVCNADYQGNNCGFIDTNGKQVTKLIYSGLSSEQFSEGLAKVCHGKEANQVCGYVDLQGIEVLPVKVQSYRDNIGMWESQLSSFQSGVALVGGTWFGNIQKWGVIDKKFKYVVKPIITAENDKNTSNPWDFDNGIQWESVGLTKDSPARTAAMDVNGNIKFFSTYDEVSPFSEGLSAVRVGDKWGFINQKNEMVVKPQFEGVRDFSEGLAAVKIGGFWGFIN